MHTYMYIYIHIYIQDMSCFIATHFISGVDPNKQRLRQHKDWYYMTLIQTDEPGLKVCTYSIR